MLDQTTMKAVRTREAKMTKKTVKKIPSIRPLGDRVIVEVLERAKVSPGGIIIEHSEQRGREHRGIVVRVGPGRWQDNGTERIPLDVKLGDEVDFDAYSIELVVDADGDMDMTKSAYAKAGMFAIVRGDALRFVVEK